MDKSRLISGGFRPGRLDVALTQLSAQSPPFGESAIGELNPCHDSRNAKSFKEVVAISLPVQAHSLACESQLNPELALICKAWPILPEFIRKAVMALINSA